MKRVWFLKHVEDKRQKVARAGVPFKFMLRLAVALIDLGYVAIFCTLRSCMWCNDRLPCTVKTDPQQLSPVLSDVTSWFTGIYPVDIYVHMYIDRGALHVYACVHVCVHMNANPMKYLPLYMYTCRDRFV